MAASAYAFTGAPTPDLSQTVVPELACVCRVPFEGYIALEYFWSFFEDRRTGPDPRWVHYRWLRFFIARFNLSISTSAPSYDYFDEDEDWQGSMLVEHFSLTNAWLWPNSLISMPGSLEPIEDREPRNGFGRLPLAGQRFVLSLDFPGYSSRASVYERLTQLRRVDDLEPPVYYAPYPSGYFDPDPDYLGQIFEAVVRRQMSRHQR